MMKMKKQRKRTPMTCTNWWLQTQTTYLISLVTFAEIPFCIGKETLCFCSNTFFCKHYQTMIIQEKLITAKNATKRYVTCLYLTKFIFLSFGAYANMKKGLKPSFLTWKTWGIFCGAPRHPREAMYKVSAWVKFFPTKDVINLDYLQNTQLLIWKYVSNFTWQTQQFLCNSNS